MNIQKENGSMTKSKRAPHQPAARRRQGGSVWTTCPYPKCKEKTKAPRRAYLCERHFDKLAQYPKRKREAMLAAFRATKRADAARVRAQATG
jgi:hypothetical protein